MWRTDKKQGKVFAGGQQSWQAAEREAMRCASFRADEEDEWAADEPRSCYNCRYRRWTVESFACLKG